MAWSGLDDGVYGTPYVQKYGDSALRRLVGTVFLHRALRSDAGLLGALIGAASGGTATKTHKEIPVPTGATTGSAGNVGGLRTAATVNDISRVTTAADITALNAYLVSESRAPTYPGDRSGNGK